MRYYYYLHFASHPAIDLATLLEEDAVVTPVFENSYEIFTDLSFSKIKHILRQHYPTDSMYFALIKKSSLRDSDLAQ